MSGSIDYDAFRAEIRDFALSHCPPHIRAIVAGNGKLTREPWAAWQRILHEHGWGAPGWPVEHGGTGWDPRQRHIFDEVLAECDCPPLYHHGLRHIGPVLIEFGTQAQKDRYLPGILSGEDWWCQGYSEPGSGSDLASLKTRAERDGDVYRVTGQKIWTSHAHEADLMYTLVRTSTEARKQQGISLLLIPVRAPGITVRPIRTIDGWHHVNEVFLDDVAVPVADRVGDEGAGWRYGKFLLERERLGAANTAPLFRLLDHTRALVRAELAEEPRRRDALDAKLLEIEADLVGARHLGIQAIDAVMSRQPLGTAPNALKLMGTHLSQEIAAVAMEAAGEDLAPRFTPVDGGANAPVPGVEWLHTYLFLRNRTIVGGTSEVQKNVIARELFGH